MEVLNCHNQHSPNIYMNSCSHAYIRLNLRISPPPSLVPRPVQKNSIFQTRLGTRLFPPRNLQKSLSYLLNEVEDIVKPLERGSAMTQPHGSPEVDWIKHEATYTHVQLVSHCEPLLCPHKVPLSSTESLEKLAQHKVSGAIATKRKRQFDISPNSKQLFFRAEHFYYEWRLLLRILRSSFYWHRPDHPNSNVNVFE